MGNSGGPLVNVDGQVIGMNTAIYSPTGGSNGIGFAIPSNQVRLISNLLMSKGKITRSMIGVAPEDVKEYERTGLLKDGGARVLALSEGGQGAAEAAGIRAGDVIVKIGDRPIRGEMDLRNAMLAYAPDASVDVKYVRDGALKTAKVKLQAFVPQTRTVTPEGRRLRRGGNPFEDLRGGLGIPDFGGDERDASKRTRRPRSASPASPPTSA